MSKHSPNEATEAAFPYLPVIFTAVISIIVTVFLLDYFGKIQHERSEGFEISDYRGILLQAGEDYRLSTKPPVIRAECVNGFVVFAPLMDQQIKALIVDYENRPVLCPKPVN